LQLDVKFATGGLFTGAAGPSPVTLFVVVLVALLSVTVGDTE
jgi:hypothetical protein